MIGLLLFRMQTGDDDAMVPEKSLMTMDLLMRA